MRYSEACAPKLSRGIVFALPSPSVKTYGNLSFAEPIELSLVCLGSSVATKSSSFIASFIDPIFRSVLCVRAKLIVQENLYLTGLRAHPSYYEKVKVKCKNVGGKARALVSVDTASSLLNKY